VRHRGGGTARPGAVHRLADLDAVTCGFRPGQVWVIASRPEQGRSTLAGQWAVRLARSGPRAPIVVAFQGHYARFVEMLTPTDAR
jgi:replicative DNA helicase